MAKEIKLPLDKALEDLERLSKSLDESTTKLLNAGDAAEKFTKSFRNTDGVKSYGEFMERAAQSTRKMQEASSKVVETEQKKRKAFDEVVASVEAARKANEANTKSLDENLIALAKEEAQVKASRETLSILNDAIDKEGKLRAEYTSKLKQSQEAIKDLNRTVRNQIKENKAADGSINQLRAQLNQLLQAYDNLSKADRDGIIGKEMLTGVKDLTEELKALEGATGRAQRNVGNYADGFKKSASSFANAFSSIIKGDISGGMQLVANGFGSLTAMSGAFIATGVGAVVVALAGAFLLVKNSVTRSEEAFNRLKISLGPFSGMLDKLMEALDILSEKYLEFVVWQLNNFSEAIMASMKAVEAALRFVKWDEQAEAVKNYRMELEAAAADGVVLAKAEIDLAKSNRKSIVSTALLKKEAAELKAIRDDEKNSMPARLDASKKLYKIESGMIQDAIVLKMQELNLLWQKNQGQLNSTAYLDKEAKLQAEILGIAAEGEELKRQANRSDNMLLNKAAKDAEAIRKAAADRAKAAREKTRAEELAMNQALLDNFKITQEKKLEFNEDFTLTAVQNYRNYLNDVFELEKENLELIAGIDYESALKIPVEKRTAIQQKLINDILVLEKERAEKINEIEKGITDFKKKLSDENLKTAQANLKLQLAYAVANGNDLKEAETKYYGDLRDLMVGYYQELTGLRVDEVLQKIADNETLKESERDYADFVIEQNKRIADEKEKQREKDFEAESKKINDNIELVTRAIGFESEIRQIQADYEKYRRAIEYEDFAAYEEAKLQIMASTANAAASILGRQTVFGKALASTAIAIDTAVAIIRTLKDVPYPLNIAAAAGIGAMGIAQIAKVNSAKVPAVPRFETGVMGSTYSGMALVDERGAEIHLDKKGNVKSFGESKANLRHVERGDSIIPAHISSKLLELMPDLGHSMVLNGLLPKKEYDFDRLERKLDEVKKEIRNTPTKDYLQFDEDYLIEVSSVNGSTHQRIVKKIGANNYKQSGLN